MQAINDLIRSAAIKYLNDIVSGPVNTVPPVISGTPAVGQTLTVSNGTWTGDPTGYTYQWRRDGTAISGATASTYLLVEDDEGTMISCTVTATNADGSGSEGATAVGPVEAAPAGHTYAEFQTHIQSLATNGNRAWTANMAATGKFYVNASSAGASGSMVGSTWGPSSAEGAQTTGSLSRGIQHALADATVYNQQISQSAQIYIETATGAFSTAALPAVTRNGFTSTASASTVVAVSKIIDLIRWDFSQNKAFRSNPSAGSSETEYTW